MDPVASGARKEIKQFVIQRHQNSWVQEQSSLWDTLIMVATMAVLGSTCIIGPLTESSMGQRSQWHMI